MLLALVPLLAARLAAAADGQLNLLHRIHGPDVPEQPFVLRASIDPSTRQYTPAPQLQDALGQFYNDVRENKAALYQVSFQAVPAGAPDHLAVERLDISSVKACHIPIASADYITLHLDRAGTPFHIDYFLADIPASGACPSTKQLRTRNLDQATFLHPSNTTINVRHATGPPLPELRVPPPLSPKGQVIPPEPEKSFIQKYWMYIVAALFVLIFAGGPPPEDDGGRASGGR
ncbi:uncharacterized protein FOMMEDRAFT_147942 [Fomitiporia mediterranea MF3/22]|uniref:uncharacterized protein n=1 Tax=Fomitiporia mediterranea (strain MF3/22) TaxID=694068 RepID=UPI000440748A|nr:uncharacterized protein FOMMEDRAFT_147942 [Fomitiporia mediterranea MF3/22]EJD01418.1 hypothetical protein FOMMEDRAFT_147942 [Fomitiporia mediterranea MF3/22]